MKKIFVFILGLCMLSLSNLTAKLTIECEPAEATLVKGLAETKTVKIFLTSEGEPVTWLNMQIALPVGLKMADGVTQGPTESVVYNSATINTERTPMQNMANGALALNIAQNNAERAAGTPVFNLQNGQKTELCSITFAADFDATEADSVQLGFSVIRCQQYNGVTNVDLEYSDETLGLTFVLLRNSYGFTTNAGAMVELDEDDDPVTIAATDTTLFTAQVWDVEAGEPVATDAVEFTAANISDAEAGTVAVEGGQIVYTPAADWSGDFTINYTATFTAIADANVDGSIAVTVNPVDDDPEIAIETEELTVDENAVLTFEMSFYDVDTEWDAYTKTVTLDGAEIAGTWARKDAFITRVRPAYTFTATEPVSYATVAHPAKTATLPLAVTLSVADDDEPLDDEFVDPVAVATADADVTVNDVDQPTDFGQTAITIASDTDPAVFGSKLTADFTNAITDPDGDVAEITYQWYRGGEAVAGETALALGTAVKKGESWTIKATAVVKPYGDEIAAQQDFESNAIVIGNTAPTTADAEVFIRKVDGGDASATVEITMADVDEDALTIEIKNQGTKGTAVVEGNAIKYTVTDTTTEFYDNDADVVTFVVNDGTADSEEATLTVTYRANPPAVVVITTPAPEMIPEVVLFNGEAASFELAISATDSNEVEPAGIKAIEWTAEEGLVIDATTTEGIDTAAATSTVVVKTNGYETLNGADRPASKEFTVTVKVTDALNAVTTETFKVTVNDVDRLAPADFTITFDPAAPKTEDDLVAVINGTPVDPDGDVITGYEFAWTVDDGAVIDDVTGETLDHSYFKKGQTVAVRAVALTAPYGGDTVYNEALAEAVSVEIANTAPALTKVEATKLDAVEDQEATEYALDVFVAAVDPDVADGIDTLTFAVEANFGEEVGTLTYDAEAGNVIFTPAPDYNTEGLEALPTFSVTVSDGEVTTDAVEVEINVQAVNDPPTATVKDVYIQPDQAGQDVTVSFAFTVGPDDESAQQVELDKSEYTAPEDGKKLLNGYAAVVDNETKTINFTFTVAEDAEIGATGTVAFSLKDNGEPVATSEEYSFKVILSGTPWYPTVVLPCEDDVEGVVVRIATDDGKTDIVVKEKNEDDKFELTPAMYYNSGFKGFARNTSGDITVYHWSAKSGTGEKCGEIEDGINVPDYQAPGKAVIEGTEGAPNVLTVSAPLASGFVLGVIDAATDKVVANVTQEFVPDGNQMETAATVTLTNLEKGKTYVVIAQGFNPMDELGEMSDEFVIDMTDDAEIWPGDGEFFPPQNWTTTVATNETDITFKWPVDAKAKSYTFKLYDGNGNAVKTVTSTVNGCQVSVAPGNYRWYVETSNGVQSDMMLFTVTKVAGGDAVIKGGTGNDNTLTLEAENLVEGKTYKFDVIYFDDEYDQWAYQLFTGTAEVTGEGELTVTGDDVKFFSDANYIMIRPTGKGDYQTLLINNLK